MNALNIGINYFKGFNDVIAPQSNTTARLLGLLKISSYFTIVLPLIFGTIIVIASICGRASPLTTLPKEEQDSATRISLAAAGVIKRKSYSHSLEPQKPLTPEIPEKPKETTQLQNQSAFAQADGTEEIHDPLVDDTTTLSNLVLRSDTAKYDAESERSERDSPLTTLPQREENSAATTNLAAATVITNKPYSYPQEPQEPLTAKIRETRIREGKKIPAKLEKELACAQAHAIRQVDGSKYNTTESYTSRPGLDELGAHFERIGKHDMGVFYAKGVRPEMQDAYLATSFTLVIGSTDYPVELFGVFDGHGEKGSEASLYLKENLQRELQATLTYFCRSALSDESIWNALKITFVRLNEDLKCEGSGTTATVAMILNGKLWTANVGDSRTILDNGTQLSEDANPAAERFKRGVENRGGRATPSYGKFFPATVEGILAMTRAIGDHEIPGVSARPKITCIDLPEEGTHLILACDGIYDVASTRQVAEAVKSNTSLPAKQLAENIVRSAYAAYSMDNLTALVVKL